MLKKPSFYHQNFYHQRIRYSFSWNYKHHINKISILNPRLYEFKKLETYFKRILNANYAKNMNNIFNSKHSKKIKKLNSESKLSKYAQAVYENFIKEKKNIPGHDPILKYILIRDKDSIAKEIPIWKKKTKYLSYRTYRFNSN